MAIKRKISKTRKKNSGDLSLGSILAFIGLGLLFGYFLSKGELTDYDSVINMFMVSEFQIYGAIGVAILVAAAGLFLMHRSKNKTISGETLNWKPVKWEYSQLIGAFIFGAGWALAGGFPSAVVTQLGEGKVLAIFTVLGILVGVWIFQKWKPKSTGDDNGY